MNYTQKNPPSYEGCSWKKRDRNFVQKQIFPMIFPKKSDANPGGQHAGKL